MKNENKPFFSVIVPVYNKEPHIARSINSILNQTFTDFELIIVCDPSTDNSNAEVAKFTDTRIRVFYRDKPGPGGYAARNLGIKNAKADWIAFLDADDEWYPERLQKTYELHREFPSAKVLSHAKVYNKNNEIGVDGYSDFSKNRLFTKLDFLQCCLIDQRPIETNSATLHKSWTDGFQWFPENRAERSGDLYLWITSIIKSNGLAWSNYIGSIYYRDLIDVSINSCPNINLYSEMVDELLSFVNNEEKKLLKKNANRLILTAWFESRRFAKKVKPLLWYFYFKPDLKYTITWSILSFFPQNIINFLRNIKHRLVKSN